MLLIGSLIALALGLSFAGSASAQLPETPVPVDVAAPPVRARGATGARAGTAAG